MSLTINFVLTFMKHIQNKTDKFRNMNILRLLIYLTTILFLDLRI